jgi:hypothetical protein
MANIRLETTSSYDQNKYESLGMVSAAMSVTVSFTATPAKPAGFFNSAPKAVPVDKQQKLTSTENQMIQALKAQLVNAAPPGTERLVDFKLSAPENIAHAPEYILSMIASATAIKKASVSNSPAVAQPQAIAMPQPMSAPMVMAQPQPMSAPMVMPQPMSAPVAAQQPMPQPMSAPVAAQQPMPQPMSAPVAAQQPIGGKRRSNKSKKARTVKRRKNIR